MEDVDHKTLIRRVAQAFNTRRVKDFEALFSPHFVLHDPRHPNWPRGLEGVRQMWTSLLSIASDMQMTIEDLISEDDKVVVRWTFQGTSPQAVHEQTGPFPAVSIAIYRIDRGKIAEDWGIAVPLSGTDTPWQ